MSRPTPEAALVNYAHRVAQQRARMLLRELTEAQRARQRARRQQQQRWLAAGEAVERAGFADWTTVELLGLLLHARDNVGSSVPMRMGFRKRGAAEWDARGASLGEPTGRAAEDPLGG